MHEPFQLSYSFLPSVNSCLLIIQQQKKMDNSILIRKLPDSRRFQPLGHSWHCFFFQAMRASKLFEEGEGPSFGIRTRTRHHSGNKHQLTRPTKSSSAHSADRSWKVVPQGLRAREFPHAQRHFVNSPHWSVRYPEQYATLSGAVRKRFQRWIIRMSRCSLDTCRRGIRISGCHCACALRFPSTWKRFEAGFFFFPQASKTFRSFLVL